LIHPGPEFIFLKDSVALGFHALGVQNVCLLSNIFFMKSIANFLDAVFDLEFILAVMDQTQNMFADRISHQHH
jgi:hypothetical protein